MLLDYLAAIPSGRGPVSLCGLDGPREGECASQVRCLVCWSRIPRHAVCVARSTYHAAGGSAIDLAPAHIHRVGSESSWVYAVHAVRPDAITATEFVSSTHHGARDYAVALSGDPGVLASAITRLTLDTPGLREGVAMFVDAKQQQAPYVSDDRRVQTHARR
ncbi:MAG TPA: hypothetical protein VE196_15085 [Pseudonocardiaceae bacterium]|nr:hypothetical protein [Pseudonocardiaceae bacterium]